MSTIPFSTMDLQTSEIEAITDIFDSLSKKFEVCYDTSFSYNFAALEIFRNRRTTIGPAIKITNTFQSFDLVFLNIGYSYAYARKYSYGLNYEYQTWGITTLKNDLGHILIKPETVLDKIHELINPVEIDFNEDPDFSKSFFVTTDDETKAKSGLTPSFRTALKGLNVKDFVIEILHNKLIIGNRKIIEIGMGIQLVNFMDNVSRLH